jgi:hypothetical protein
MWVKGLQMKNIVSVLALVALAAVSAAAVSAQTTRRAAGAAAQSSVPAAVAALPASDAVVAVDAQRLYKEALPRIFASEPAKLAEINADMDEFKTRTGLDPRQFERVGVGVKFVATGASKVKMEAVAVARGNFNAAALVAAGRIAAQGKYAEQRYKGKTIYVFTLDRQLGFLNLKWTELAAVVLDRNTLAFGQADRVRATIDAATGGAHVSAEVAALATRVPNAIIGLGGNVPAALTHQLDFLSPEITRSIASIRQFYGTVGADAAGFQMMTVLRTDDAAAARTLTDTVEGLRQLAPFAIGRLQGEKAKLAQQLVDNTKVAVQGNEVHISLDLADANVATLVRVF